MNGSSEGGGLATGWHLSVGGTTYGPYDWAKLVAWVREGRVGPDDLVWQSQLPTWMPARQVPGLFPGAPVEATAGRRRRSGLLIAVACAAAVVVLAGAGVGTWLTMRGDGHVGETIPLAEDQEETKVEELSLGGKVVLPEGTAFSPADLALLSNTSEASSSATGDFQLSAVHDEGARTMLLAVNGDRNPVLMAIAESSTADLEPSVASTARALVLYDPAFLSLPRAAYAAAAERLESDPRLSELQSTLSEVLRSDAVAPLDADAHPQVYDLAAEMAADLLAGIIEVEEQAAQRPVLLASLAPATRSPMLLAAAATDAFVDVLDDPGHATPEVTLVNTTWAGYNVSWTRTTAEGSSNGKAFLPRCAPWRVDLGSLRIGWPPVGFKLEKLIDVGDGQLSFQFRRNDEYMTLDIIVNVGALILGAGAESIRKLAGGGADAAAILNTGGAAMQLSKELGALAGRLQGQSFAGCAKEVGGFFAVNGGRVLAASWPLLKNEIKEEFVTVLGKVITRRMAALAVLGYGSVDLIAQIKALGDPAIASYDTGGVQLAGVYPLTVGLELSVTPKQAKTYVFEAVISGLPPDFSVPMELVIDFGDGSKKERIQPNFESGQATVAFKHAYAGEVPNKMQVVLQTLAEKPALMASREADLPVEEAKPDELWFTVLFQGGGSFKVTVDGAPGPFKFDFLRYLDPINVYRNGAAHVEYSDPYGSCTFDGRYDKSTKTLTGKYESSFMSRDSNDSEYSESLTGTFEGTLVYRPNEVEGKPNIFTMKGKIICTGQVTFVDNDGDAQDDSYQKPIEIDYSFVANGDTGPE